MSKIMQMAGRDYAPVLWQRYQFRHPDDEHPADTRILAYRLDTRLLLIYPDAQTQLELGIQRGEPGDYVAVLVAGRVVARLGSGLFIVPGSQVENVWEPEPVIPAPDAS